MNYNTRSIILQCKDFDFYLIFCLLRLHGSYEALKYGTTLDGFADLSGGITESIPLRQDPTSCSRLLNKLLQMTSIVTVAVRPSPNQVLLHFPRCMGKVVVWGDMNCVKIVISTLLNFPNWNFANVKGHAFILPWFNILVTYAAMQEWGISLSVMRNK